MTGAFDTPEVVGSRKKPQTGMAKYISFYNEMHRKSKSGTANTSKNQFDHWTKEKLAKEAKNFLSALRANGLLADKHKPIKDLLAGEARTA
ncbi:hypothetical protein MPEAHAMD_4839 [Methylobacterium frigidaeris]|uniref:Uncharacterized protein n=2 Tax=Methylobacterium frigidaeris TaxID=2038277 RepID=A0AA37HFL0_9HYPH|nr:hypothetical protein MPEAHAMD_4839 [Methylobacterium frigidaeris]